MRIIPISSVADIKKLLAFLRAGVEAVFSVENAELRDAVVQEIRAFARAHRVSIRVIEPDGDRVTFCTTAGAVIGAGVGAATAGLPGAVLGVGVGALSGYALAQLRVTVHPREGRESGFIIDLARP